MSLLLGLLSFALAQTSPKQELVTSSGRKYEVSMARPAAIQASGDGLVIVHSTSLYQLPDVHLKVSKIVKIAERLAVFRTNEEMLIVPRVGNTVTSFFKENPDEVSDALKRRRGMETKKEVKRLLDDLYKASGSRDIPTEEVHEVALMIALGQDKGHVAFATIHKPEIYWVPQVVGFGSNYLMSALLLHSLPFRFNPFNNRVTNFCSRLLGSESESKIRYSIGLALRSTFAAAGLLDATGRIIDIHSDLDPGWSPLLSYLIFGDMEPEGNELRAGATAFETKYQLK